MTTLEQECKRIEIKKVSLTVTQGVRDILFRVDLHFLKDISSYVKNMNEFLNNIINKEITNALLEQIWADVKYDSSPVLSFIQNVNKSKISRGVFAINNNSNIICLNYINYTDKRKMEL